MIVLNKTQYLNKYLALVFVSFHKTTTNTKANFV